MAFSLPEVRSGKGIELSQQSWVWVAHSLHDLRPGTISSLAQQKIQGHMGVKTPENLK